MNTSKSLSSKQLQNLRSKYYGAKRRVNSLEGQKSELVQIIKSGRRPINSDGIQKTRPLSTAERTDFRRRLENVKFDLEFAKVDLAKNEFNYKKASQAIKQSTIKKKHSIKQKMEDQKLELAKKYMKRAQEEGIKEFTQMKSGKLSDDDIKRLVLKAAKKYHNGMPIRNISKDSIAKISEEFLGGTNGKTKSK